MKLYNNILSTFKTRRLWRGALTVFIMVALYYLGTVLPDKLAAKRQAEGLEIKAILIGPLQSYIDTTDNAPICVLAGLSEVGSGADPLRVMLAKDDKDGFYRDFSYYADNGPVVPGGIMQTATLMFYLDKGRITLNMNVPTNNGKLPELMSGFNEDPHIIDYERTTGRDSISIREGFLRSYRYVTNRYVLDDIRRGPSTVWYTFVDQFMDYFGPSSEYFLPRFTYKSVLEKEALSIANGTGIILSQDQILNLYGSIANGGVKPAYRYHRKKAFCSENTAREISIMLRHNVLEGTGRTLKDSFIPIAGKYGTGILDKGHLPLYGNVQEKGLVYVTSFVGFFPADAPKYTLCVSMYYDDYPNYELCKRAFGDIVDQMNENGLL